MLIIIIILFLTIILIIFSNNLNINQNNIRGITLFSSMISFFISIFFWIFFDRSCWNYQYVYKNNFLDFIINKYLISFGIDGISLFFILLSTFIIPLCVLTCYKENFLYIKDYCLYLLILEIFLILSFSAIDLILFFIFFESILIPMFFIIGIWGSRERRVRATFYFFLYTLVGSIFLFFSILIIYYDIGTTNFYILSKIKLNLYKQIILWLFLYIVFSVKIPTIPVHIWLPEAHVEAPTAGSVILAGLLLKLGGYGFIRVLLSSFSKATIFYLPLTDTFSIISVIFASLTTIRQIDMKRMVAYSSIAHMNLVVLGIFSGNTQGVIGSIFLMVGHGIVSSAFFFLIGALYDKYGSRIIYYYGGLVRPLPLFSVLWIFFSFANIGFPGQSNFIGEISIFIGLIDKSIIILLMAMTSVILSVLSNIFFVNRFIFGHLNVNYIFIFTDLNKRELMILLPLFAITIIIGLFPDLICDTALASVLMAIEY